MSAKLRLQILVGLSSAVIKEDVELAEELGQSKEEIQIQLDILENQGFGKLTKTFGPSYDAEITPGGRLYLEQVEEQLKKQKPKNPLGFKPPKH